MEKNGMKKRRCHVEGKEIRKKRKMVFSYSASLFSSWKPCLQITYFALLRNDTTFNLLCWGKLEDPSSNIHAFFFFLLLWGQAGFHNRCQHLMETEIMWVLQFRREVINLYSPFSFLQMKVCLLVFNKHLHENRNFSLRSLSPAA